jgi:hypothetical protein
MPSKLLRSLRARIVMSALFAAAVPLLVLPAERTPAAAPAYGASAIRVRDGYPVFTVEGRPFFIWGAAFFYERIPRDRWESALRELEALHVNTLDLYVPWNWHEVADGDFDFTGRTDPRRDLRGLLRLARDMGFYLVIRPGPVIRNEWRNGGYPAWLLRRPEYGMPLHDVLQGRYPATATLQNARSDDAAAQWLRNRTHLRYARRWLQRVLTELRPVAGRVLAIALDDDQGAYLTNQTWPAPHLQAYVRYLAAIVHADTSPRVPVFINTYEMKVPASSPVWTMGNWYQSDAYRIGEHDRAQMQFATSLLGTRPQQPIALSEFQAGWLMAPEDIYPRPADPSNTLLALHTALSAGARGVIDFPMQDTFSPPGWEAPFANRFYAWDAALNIDGGASRRYAPTLAFGRLVARDGSLLAATHLVADAAIVWWPSALPAPLSDAATLAIADATIAAQRNCVRHELTCALVDLRFATRRELRRYPALIVPALPAGMRPLAPVRSRLERIARERPVLTSLDGAAARRIVAQRAVRGLPGATLHVGEDPSGALVAFLDTVNYSMHPVHADVAVRYRAFRRRVHVDLAPRDARTFRIDRSDKTLPAASTAPVPSRRGIPIRRDLDAPRSAIGSIVLENTNIRLVLSRRAGGRAFVFEDRAHHTSAFTTVGALRDDVSIKPPPSATDRIAAFTHTFPAGTFNRTYRVRRINFRTVALSYAAPDVIPSGAAFQRVVTLPEAGDEFSVRERLVPSSGDRRQRLVVRSSLAIGRTDEQPWRPPWILATLQPLRPNSSVPLDAGEPLALYDVRTRELILVRWQRASVEAARLNVYDRDAVLELRYAPGWHTTWYAYSYVDDIQAARARLRAAAREMAR